MYENMTDEEFYAIVEERYGKDWNTSDLEPGSEIAEEYAKRVSEGV